LKFTFKENSGLQRLSALFFILPDRDFLQTNHP
jgi:hypothetical protein